MSTLSVKLIGDIRTEQLRSVFIVSGVLMFGVSLIAMSYQVLKVALGNPVEALRYE